MSLETPDIIYTCDICGKTPLRHDEVGSCRVGIERPPQKYIARGKAYLSSVSFDACAECLGTKRAPNPDPEFDNTVHIGPHDLATYGKKFTITELTKRIFQWVFTKEEDYEQPSE